MKLDCPFCCPEVEKSMSVLEIGDQEYYLSVHTNDGTKKWYKCENCNGIFCRDKMKKIWQLSPKTYNNFLEKGWIKDLLNN